MRKRGVFLILRVTSVSMDEFYYNCSINEAAIHSPYEVMYGYQPSSPTDKILPIAGATADAADRLIVLANLRVVITQLIKLSKERMATRSTRFAPIFQPGDFVYHSTRGLNIR